MKENNAIDVSENIKNEIKSNDVVLFMKGTPVFPMCGFSAATVQVLEMVIDRFSPSLYMALGIFLPLITVNCAILGVALFMEIRGYSFIQSLVFAFGSGLGWWLAIVSLAAIQKKVLKAPVPEGLKGAGITLITIGFMAMAFIGFSGMLVVQ